MLSRRTLPVWAGIILVSGMFLMGQEDWGPAGPSITYIDPPAAPCGQEVTILGGGFGANQNTSTVTFNGVDAGTAVSWTDPAIRVTVPAEAATGPVVVTVGGIPSNGFPFTVGPAVECEVDADCDDGNECTHNVCDPGTGTCSNPALPTGTPCEDGNPCTAGDTCHQGSCTAGPCASLGPLDPCCADPACMGQTICEPGECATDADCDDGNPCTTYGCDYPTGTCSYEPADGMLCDNGNACTIMDTCQSGVCVGGPPLDCNDGNPCTDESCDPALGCLYLCTAVGHPDPCCGDPACVDEEVCALPGLPPDTGQGLCYDNTGEIACPGPGAPFHGQDAQYVIHPMSYTDNGDGTVMDNVTGLMWQKCSAGLSGPECSEGTASTMNWTNALAHCEALVFAEHTDWRLPDEYELQGIVNYGSSNPSIDPLVFPATVPEKYYWSSSAFASGTLGAWDVSFDHGVVGNRAKGTASHVRCVRGEKVFPSSFWDNGDGTVTDEATGLMWQQQDDGTMRNWEAALAYCQNLVLPAAGGHADWRLPNIKELRTIVDSTQYNPAIDPVVFPATRSSSYWSSSTYGFNPAQAWHVTFLSGTLWNVGKTTAYYVRCVR